MARVEEGLTSNPIGLPKVLLGGAFLSGLISGLSRAMLGVLQHAVADVVVAAVAIAVFMALAWVALFSGGVARRRIHALAGGQGPKRSRLQRHKSDLGGRVSVA